MADLKRLKDERWIIEKKNNVEIVLNYCRTITPHPWGSRVQTFKLDLGKCSQNYLVINRVCYNYFITNPIELPPELCWVTYKTIGNGKKVSVIIKKPENYETSDIHTND